MKPGREVAGAEAVGASVAKRRKKKWKGKRDGGDGGLGVTRKEGGVGEEVLDGNLGEVGKSTRGSEVGKFVVAGKGAVGQKRKRSEEGVGGVEKVVKKRNRRRQGQGKSSNSSRSVEGGFEQRSKGSGSVAEVEILDGPTKPRASVKSMSFMDKMRAQLSGGQFRMLNETLYTCRGEDAFKLFQKDEGAFQLYHTGYQEQMSHWPRLPVQVVMDWLKARSANLVVADFGCGDARLAKGVKNKVYSLDLVACEDSVIACNMAKTPLETKSVDVAVFCLSLMGVDYPSFLKEAHRVLRLRGLLLIAEVKSRFDPANGGADPDQFVDALKGLGFYLVSQDTKNKMFVMFIFKKQGEQSGRKVLDWPDLKPCVYKKR